MYVYAIIMEIEFSQEKQKKQKQNCWISGSKRIGEATQIFFIMALYFSHTNSMSKRGVGAIYYCHIHYK